MRVQSDGRITSEQYQPAELEELFRQHVDHCAKSRRRLGMSDAAVDELVKAFIASRGGIKVGAAAADHRNQRVAGSEAMDLAVANATTLP